MHKYVCTYGNQNRVLESLELELQIWGMSALSHGCWDMNSNPYNFTARAHNQ